VVRKDQKQIDPDLLRKLYQDCDGFEFLCHEIRHPNRKAGEERSFWTVETNFLPGRRFSSLEDLNQQDLTQLSCHLPAPYCLEERSTDQYGFMAYNGNYFWVPGNRREDVRVFRYAEHLKIFQHRTCVAEYRLPAEGVKNERISPEGQPQPRHQPHNRKRDSQAEETRLQAMGADVTAYLEYAVKTAGIQRHRFTRELFALSRRVTPWYNPNCQRAARSVHRSALGMCRVRSSPACRTERQRSLERPGPKGNAQMVLHTWIQFDGTGHRDTTSTVSHRPSCVCIMPAM